MYAASEENSRCNQTTLTSPVILKYSLNICLATSYPDYVQYQSTLTKNQSIIIVWLHACMCVHCAGNCSVKLITAHIH